MYDNVFTIRTCRSIYMNITEKYCFYTQRKVLFLRLPERRTKLINRLIFLLRCKKKGVISTFLEISTKIKLHERNSWYEYLIHDFKFKRLFYMLQILLIGNLGGLLQHGFYFRAITCNYRQLKFFKIRTFRK